MDRPRLRKVERIREAHPDGARIVLHDPLGLSEDVAVDAEFEPVLDRLDGSRTLAQIRQSLLLAGGPEVSAADLEAFVADLSDAGLLDDGAFAQRAAQIVAAYDEAPVRPPAASGTLFPAEASAAGDLLAEVLPAAGDRFDPDAGTCAVIAPALGPGPAAPLLDATLRALPPPGAVDVLVVLGVDPMPGHLPLSICPKDYGTVLGPVPVHRTLVEELARRDPALVREALRHRSAVSVEVAATYARWIYGERTPPVVPILASRTATSPGPERDAALGTLEATLAGQRVLWWGSCELSHTGPAYGTEHAPDRARRADRRRIDALRAGHAERFERITAQQRPGASGSAVLVPLLHLLPAGARASFVDYRLLPPAAGVDGLAGCVGMRFATR